MPSFARDEEDEARRRQRDLEQRIARGLVTDDDVAAETRRLVDALRQVELSEANLEAMKAALARRRR